MVGDLDVHHLEPDGLAVEVLRGAKQEVQPVLPDGGAGVA
jgi:hypothetical protein